MERAVCAVRPDVADRFDFNVFRITTADQHIALVAGTNDGDANGISDLAIAIVHRAESSTAGSTGTDDSAKEITPIDIVVGTDGVVIIVGANGALIR